MMRSTISILALYNFDNSIFEGLRLPESIAEQREAVIDTILLECAELEIVYPDFDIMKLAIRRWCDLELPIWAELQATREYEYNPIWNKDGIYTDTETRDLSGTRRLEERGGSTVGTQRATQNAGNSTDTQQVQGFNDEGWSDAQKDIRSGTESENVTETVIGTNNNTDIENTTDFGTVTHERMEQGNIGVTTTQQMIKEQREVVDFSTEKYIVKSFKRRFCLLVY